MKKNNNAVLILFTVIFLIISMIDFIICCTSFQDANTGAKIVDEAASKVNRQLIMRMLYDVSLAIVIVILDYKLLTSTQEYELSQVNSRLAYVEGKVNDMSHKSNNYRPNGSYSNGSNSSKKYCPKCETEFPGNSFHCPYCGTKLVNKQ